MIVNADDFGMTPGVCRGVLRAHAGGVVTSTSALVVGPAFRSFAPSLRDAGISVGAHLALVGEDPPLLTAAEIPSLVDARGRFPLHWQQVVRRALCGLLDTDDIRREFAAQMELLGSYSLPLTHLDSHQNLHLWPQVATVVLEIAARWNLHAVRLTRTARWDPRALGVRTLSGRLAGRARRSGLSFPDASAGLDEAGALDRTRFLGVIDRLASSGAQSAELVTHVAEDPDPDRGRYAGGYRWADELAAACDPGVRAAIRAAGFTLGDFSDLPRAGG